MKNYLLQIVIGTLFYLALGWFVFDLLLGRYTDLNTTQLPGFKKTEEEFSLLFIVVSCCAYACLLTFVLSHLLQIDDKKKGFYIGAIIGILVAIMADTYWLASSHFYANYTVVLLDILAAGVTVGATGFVITWLRKIIR